MRDSARPPRLPGKALRGAFYLLPLGLAAGFAAFCATRSDALDRAEGLLPRAHDPKALAHVHRLAREHLARQPWSQRAACLAAVTLSRLDFPKQAEAYYARCGSLSLDDAHVRAYAILRSNDRDAALEAYRQIARRWPDDPRALRMTGGIYFSRRQYVEALEIARRLQQTSTGAAEGHRLEATIKHETGDTEEAAQHYLDYLRLDPRQTSIDKEARPAFWLSFGNDMIAAGRAAQAIPLLSDALAETDDPVVRTILGRALRQTGDDRSAESHWRAAIARRPELAAAWLELGKLLLARNDVDGSLEYLSQAATLAPGSDEVLYVLAQAQRRAGRLDEARATDARLQALQRRNPRPARGMGAPAVDSPNAANSPDK